MRIFIALMLVAMLVSCNGNLPNGILGQEKMESILWEQMQADAFTREFVVKDTSKKMNEENLKLQQKIFAKYKTDKETFYKSYKYYLSNKDILKPLIDSIVSKQTRQKQEGFIKQISNRVYNDWQWFKKYESVKVLKPYKLNSILIISDSLKQDTINANSILPFKNMRNRANQKQISY